MNKVLVACEESQALTIELRRIGVEAYSCDILPCSGGHPEWHLEQDVTPLLDYDWHMIVAFPPCTDLAISGATYFEQKRKDGRQQRSIDFFMSIANAKSHRIAIENPVSIMSTVWRKPDQIIQPYEYGDMQQKKTCLWLKNLPKLQSTNNVYEEMMKLPKNQRERIIAMSPSKDRAKLKSKTFPGIAKAMAEQWGVL